MLTPGPCPFSTVQVRSSASRWRDGLAASVPDDGSEAYVAGSVVSTHPYGPGTEQVGDLTVPAGPAPAAGWPVVALVHGGFWRDRYHRDLMAPLAADLAAVGSASWNLEYRRVGPTGGGVPATLEDVAAAVDHLAVLATEQPLDLDRVSVVGHSAGGQLALWLTSRSSRPDGAPGSPPEVRPVATVAQAPVASLLDAGHLGEGAVGDWLGCGPDDDPARYALADPIRWVGHGVPVLLVHADGDTVVPLEQSQRYESAASAAGDPVVLTTGPGDHMAVIDPDGELWRVAVRFLEHHR
jgi:acetyl esterase/lipase